MQCRSCTPWLASVLCFTNSKTSTASHCILLLPRGRMEIAEKPASRRKKAGFTFSERFGATIGQHPVITLACQANSTRPLPVCCRINQITSLTVFTWVKHQHVEYGRTDNGPYSCSGGKSTGTKSIHSIFSDHKQTRMSHMAKSVLCHLFWQAYGFIVEINGAAIRQQLRTIASKGNQGRACMIPIWTA